MASILLHPPPLEPFSRTASAASELSGAAVQRCSMAPPYTAAPSRLGSTTTPGFPLEPAEGGAGAAAEPASALHPLLPHLPLRPQRSNSLGVFQFERRIQSAPVKHQRQEGSSSVPSGQQQQHQQQEGSSGTETVQSYSTEDGLEVASRPALDVVPPTDSTGFRFLGVRHRTKSLCRVFGLPKDEDLLSEWHAALRKKVLLQGRMYVFANFLCFTSNPFFGYIKKVVVPYKDIVAVRKKTHFRLANSIEIETSAGDKQFFTNLLHRQQAYRLILRCWAQARPLEAQAQQEQPSAATSLDGASEETSMSMSPELASQRRSDHFQFAPCAKAPSEPSSRSQQSSWLAEERQQPPRMVPSSSDMQPLNRGHLEPPSPPQSTSAWSKASLSPAMGGSVFCADISDEDEDEDRAAGNAVMALVEPGPPPPKAADARVVLSTVVPGTPATFFSVLLATESHFMEDFLESQGNRRINLTPWKLHQQLAHIRDLTFVAPIKGAFGNWGVSHTQCFQAHRFSRHAGDRLVFESSQTMTDIPYGDCFTVDIRWDVEPVPASELEDAALPMLNVDIVVRIPFQRTCLFKKVIESGTQKQVLQTYTAMVAALRPAMVEASLPATLPLHAQHLHTRTSSNRVLGTPMGSVRSPPMASPMVSLQTSYNSYTEAAGPGAVPTAEAAPPQQEEEPAAVISTPDGKVAVAVPLTSKLLSPTVLHMLQAQASTRTRYMRSCSNSAVQKLGHGLHKLLRGLARMLVGLAGGNELSPQLLWLTVMVTCMFLCQLCMLAGGPWAGSVPGGVWWRAGGGSSSSSSASSSSGGSIGGGTQGMSLGERDQEYWAQRFEMLQAELNLLRQRTDVIVGEMAFSLQNKQDAERYNTGS